MNTKNIAVPLVIVFFASLGFAVHYFASQKPLYLQFPRITNIIERSHQEEFEQRDPTRNFAQVEFKQRIQMQDIGKTRSTEHSQTQTLEKTVFQERSTGQNLEETASEQTSKETRLKQNNHLYLHYKNFLETKPLQQLENYKNPCWREKRKQEIKLKCIPYFYLAGMAKCGTSDLWYALNASPHVTLASYKEPFWWTVKRFAPDDQYDFEVYSAYFANASEKIGNVEINGYHPIVTGEATPNTMWMNNNLRYPENADRKEPVTFLPDEIHHLTPNAKVIMTLRNPTDRLYSDFMYFKKSEDNPKTFHESVVQSLETMKKCLFKSTEKVCAYSHGSRYYFETRVYLGMYIFFIQEWLRVFPRNQVLVTRLEDYAINKEAVLDKIFNFLEVAPTLNDTNLNPDKIVNRRAKKDREKGPMLNKTRKLLDYFYEPYNRRLASLLDDSAYLWR